MSDSGFEDKGVGLEDPFDAYHRVNDPSIYTAPIIAKPFTHFDYTPPVIPASGFSIASMSTTQWLMVAGGIFILLAIAGGK